MEDGIRRWLEQPYDLTFVARKKGPGIDAKSLNRELRGKAADALAGIHGETHVEYGTFFHNGVNGFDFSLYDETYALVQLRNALIGAPGELNGEEKLRGLYQKAGEDPAAWQWRIQRIGGVPGEPVHCDKTRLTVVGELQFGNWALVKHDLLRLLNASDTVAIDYYIYITACGSLLAMLSDGVVSYQSTVEAIRENRRLLKIPMWIIGLDCDMG